MTVKGRAGKGGAQHLDLGSMLGRRTLFLLGLACLLQSTAGFAVAGGRLALARPHAAARPRFESNVHMKSKEDKEFEEWVRQKKIASGVDPDEDFETGRNVEGNIYIVGGKASRATTPRATLSVCLAYSPSSRLLTLSLPAFLGFSAAPPTRSQDSSPS